MRSLLKDLALGDAGSMLIAGAVLLAVLALLGGVVLEVGQWFEHRRALQVRTDAATLAAGQALNACFSIPSPTYPDEKAADAYIESQAGNYGGFTTTATGQTGSPYNPQFGSGSSFMSFQSDTNPTAASHTYPTGSGSPPAKSLGNECFIDGNPANTDPSNVNLMEDVRTTQAGIRPFFSFSPFATVHGHARVQLQAITDFQPVMPLAIPDVDPKAVAVTFVNNATGAKIAGPFALNPVTISTISSTLNGWGGSASFTMPSANTNVGMRVSIGSQNGDCSGNTNATSTFICYDYSNTGSANPNGILAIRSYSDSGTGSSTAPILRSVTPYTCATAAGSSPYFSTYQANQVSTAGTCPASVSAVVDFGSGDPTKEQIQGSLKGTSGGSIPLAFSLVGGAWVSDSHDLPVGQGPYDVTLQWKYGTGKWNNFNSGQPVQQIFSGSDGSDPTAPGGPIMAAWIHDSSDRAVYSLPAGNSETVNVSIALTGGVHVNPKCPGNTTSSAGYQCASDPTVLLKTTTKSASLTYAIDCGTVPGHTGGTLYQQMLYGCANTYSFNSADVCPDPANPTPTDCASVQTGVASGQVRQALNDLLAPGGQCATNNYPNTAVASDKRVVMLIVTDFSAYIGSGGTTKVPVIRAATFYITGWSGSDSSCDTQNEPAPPGAAGAGPNSGDIWGHFINYATGGGTPSGLKCDLTSVAPCVAALVR